MKLTAAAAALLLITSATSTEAERGPGRGPLPVRDQFPLEMISLNLTPRGGGWLERGQWGIEFGLVHANTFEISEDFDARAADFDDGAYESDYSFIADGETTRAHLRIDFGVGSRVQLGLEVPLISHQSGSLDSLIDSVHDSLGLPSNDRDQRPKDQLEFDMIAGGSRFQLLDDETELGDVVVSATVGLFAGERSAVSLVLEAKAPTGDEAALAGSGSWDYGLSFFGSAASQSERHVWHWGVGWFALGEAEQLPIDFDDKLSGSFAYEYRPNERWSVVAQAMLESSGLPEKPDSPQGDPRAGIAVGFHRGGEDWQISAGFLENITTSDNSIDFGLFFAASWKL